MKFSSHSKRLFMFGSVSIVSVLLMIAIFVLINYLSQRHFYRADLTESKIHSISDKSRKIISSITGDINIYVFYPPSSRLYPYIAITLDELARYNNRVKLNYVDIDKDLIKTQEYRQKFKLVGEDYIVIEKGDQFRVLTTDDIAEYDYQGAMYGQEPVLKGFKGETAVISAILSVSEDKRIKIYFTSGHGEKDINDYKGELGYAQAQNILRHNNYLVENVVLAQEQSISEKTDLLIIAGPQKPFIPHEIELIKSYLDLGKPIMLLLDPQINTGLEPLLAGFGIGLTDDIVIDPEQYVPFAEPSYLISNIAGENPIGKPLENMMGMFYLARSITEKDNETRLNKFMPLVITTDQGWGETKPSEQPLRKDDHDIAGPVTIAAAIENPVENSNDGYVRIVVFGDSDFLTNSQIGNLANTDIFENSVNWLLQQERNIGISSKKFERKLINITSEKMFKLTIIVMVFMPSLTLVLGIIVWRIRKK